VRGGVNEPYPTSPYALFASAWGNRQLIVQLTRRKVLSRYRGSILGLASSFFNPLLMLVVYAFVFKARWGPGDESEADFAIVFWLVDARGGAHGYGETYLRI
jgi:lipopolysaccharide transport system permease protein